MPETVKTWTVTPESGDGIDYAARKPVGQQAVGPIYTLTDLGELAARIAFNVPNTHDRRGNVIWADNFEDNINKWAQTTLGAGASIALSTDYARSGAKSGKLVTGNASDDHATITKHLPYSVLSKFGFEISFMPITAGANLCLIHALLVLTGTRYLLGSVRWNPNTLVLEYITTGGTWTTLATSVNFAYGDSLFHTIKSVIDPSTEKYVRLILDNTEYDMSALSLYAFNLSIAATLQGAFQVMTKTSDSRTCYVDDAIVTQNEPESE